MATLPSLTDLYKHGAPSSSFGSLTDPERVAGIEAAYGELESAAASQGKMPLLDPLPADIVQKVCAIAAYELMSRAGFNPTQGADVNFTLRCQAARLYFRDIAKGIVNPPFVYSTARVDRAQPQVRSKPLRGW